jgi:hypothetical protein
MVYAPWTGPRVGRAPIFSRWCSACSRTFAGRRFIGKVAAMTVEVAPRPFGHGPPDTPPAYEKVPPVAGGGHGEGVLVDECDGQAIGAAPKETPENPGASMT